MLRHTPWRSAGPVPAARGNCQCQSHACSAVQNARHSLPPRRKHPPQPFQPPALQTQCQHAYHTPAYTSYSEVLNLILLACAANLLAYTLSRSGIKGALDAMIAGIVREGRVACMLHKAEIKCARENRPFLSTYMKHCRASNPQPIQDDCCHLQGAADGHARCKAMTSGVAENLMSSFMSSHSSQLHEQLQRSITENTTYVSQTLHE